MGLSPLTRDLATGKNSRTAARTFTCLSCNTVLGWHSLVHLMPGRSAKEALMVLQQPLALLWLKVKSDLCLSASQGYASNVKGKGVQLIQKADLSHVTDAKTEFLPT